MNEQGPVRDFIRAIWELLRECFAWVRDEWVTLAHTVRGLEWRFEAFCLALVVILVVVPLVQAWITRPKR